MHAVYGKLLVVDDIAVEKAGCFFRQASEEADTAALRAEGDGVCLGLADGAGGNQDIRAPSFCQPLHLCVEVHRAGHDE